MLIRHAEVWRQGLADVRVANGLITAIGALEPLADEPVFDARGGALLPGLHDHHIHLPALAASRSSLACGPPQVHNAAELAAALATLPGTGWIRGVGYHDSVMGLPDASALDTLEPDRPLRVQHRTGRMWLFNTPALECLLALAPPPPGLERDGAGFTGRLFDEDAWLRTTLSASPPDLSAISHELARHGVTGLTEMGPGNDPAFAAMIAAQHSCGGLMQNMALAGQASLAKAPRKNWALGPLKLHLHEAAMPPWDDVLALHRTAREQGRALAVHCTTEVELVYTLALFEEAGAVPGDRIEHASLSDAAQVDRIAALGLAVVAQPHFVRERGDQYLADIPPEQHANLYRLRSLQQVGIILAGGSDAPFGSPDPWQAMAAAMDRQTPSGAVICGSEALDAETALALYLSDPLDLKRERRIEPGVRADLCLLDRPWMEARESLSASLVRATWIGGQIVRDGIDQA